MPTTSGDNKQPPTGTTEAVCALFEMMMQKDPTQQERELLYYYERSFKEDDMDQWPNNKAVVLVEDVQGNRMDYHEYDTNQQAADFMFTFFRKPVNITYKPVGARRDCFHMESSEVEEKALLLDIMLDNL